MNRKPSRASLRPPSALSRNCLPGIRKQTVKTIVIDLSPTIETNDCYLKSFGKPINTAC